MLGCHYLGGIRANKKGLIFALLYRNLMAACQIWCEHHAALALGCGAHPESDRRDIGGSLKTELARFLWVSPTEFELVRGIEP